MARLAVMAACGVGWLVVLAGVAAPLVGMALGAARGGHVATDLVAVPSGWVLLVRSLVQSAVATAGAVILGLLPAAVLGASRGRRASVLLGLTLAPLLAPPQVYAYAWQLASGPDGLLGGLLPSGASIGGMGGAVRSGLISAGWLWPVVAMIVSAGWRSTGSAVYALAMLDARPMAAYVRAVLPSLRPHLLAAAAGVFVITLVEYAIPHLTLTRVYATELLVLVDVGAPPGQVMRMAVQVIGVVAVLAVVAGLGIRSTSEWQAVEADEDALLGSARGRAAAMRLSPAAWLGAVVVWLVTMGVPVVVMWRSFPTGWAWREGFVLFGREWGVSLVVALAAGALAVCLAIGTIGLGRATGWRWPGIGSLGALLVAAVPPAALGIGLVVIYNRGGFVGDLYRQTPAVWALGLAGRYGAVAVLIAWLATGRRSIAAAEQARTDGAGGAGVLTYVLLPMMGRSLLAAGLIVTGLALFEVVLTQLVGPVGWPSIAMTILGHMHYGRDDVVITTSIVVMAAGVLLTQACGWLLTRGQR